jgi:cytochrome c biogenesis protein CcmG/thiol:disulfide interchange protein DsbE
MQLRKRSEPKGLRAPEKTAATIRCVIVALGFLAFTPLRAASPLDLASLTGRVVYLDFWASWCGPCRQSFPWMQTMINAYQGKGLAIVAVNLDRDRVDADKFLDQFKPTFDVRFDPKGEFAEFYKIKGMPVSLLIDRHGVTRFTHVGFRPVDAAAYETQLRELLAEK